jgi:uncharacterized membrane protein
VTEPGLARGERLHGIDVLRGLVMVLMALDHARDYFGDLRIDPTNLAVSTPALFATRWVTHFCAPVFVLLAGTSAYLHGRRLPTRGALARFLAARGVWLVVLELTVVTFAWQLAFTGWYFLQVIWAIGIGMLVLSALVFLPARVVGLVGLAIVAGHNALDSFAPEGARALTDLWRIAHVQGPLRVGGSTLLILYPALPWIGVIALGYGLGPLFALPRTERRGILLFVGLGGCLLFALLRASNLYGDPGPWARQDGLVMTVVSFLNCQKYPPSLLYLAMTLGPALTLLALVDEEPGFVGRRLETLGRVPLFYYLAHLFALSVGSLLFHRATLGLWFRTIADGAFGSYPAGYGGGLARVYLVWAVVVVALYPACAWYAGVKRRSRSRLLSYL